jgi:hypothetical protein
MTKSALISGFAFSIFSLFLFIQQRYQRNAKIQSNKFWNFVVWFSFAGYLGQITYFIFYGWNVSWLEAVLIFIVAVIFSGSVNVILQKFINEVVLVMMGFLIMPASCYLMFASILKQ